MSLAHSMRLVLAPPHRAARPFLIGGAVVALGGGLLAGPWLFWPGLLFTLFCLYFFRDPERTTPHHPRIMVAPADGRVVSVVQAVPPEELGLGEAPLLRQATFSLWRDAKAMDAYARNGAHQAAIQAAWQHRFFSESMFVRFTPIAVQGSWKGRFYG